MNCKPNSIAEMRPIMSAGYNLGRPDNASINEVMRRSMQVVCIRNEHLQIMDSPVFSFKATIAIKSRDDDHCMLRIIFDRISRRPSLKLFYKLM